MHTLLKTKIGPFLVVFSVLAVWTLLAAQHVQAHTLTDPSCSGLPTADNFFTSGETAALSNGTASATPTPKKGTGASGGGRAAHYYAKITVPALTAGELTVTGNSDDAPSEAVLCRGSSQIAISRPSYASAHNSANAAADTATRAEAAARETNASESTAKSALRNAATALRAAATALTNLATTLTNAGETTDAQTATDAATAATGAATAATDAADAATNTSATDEADALDIAAAALDIAAAALGAEMVFDPMTALISSGTEEYVVVVTIPADDDTIAALTVSFRGVMSTVATAPDGGSFTTNNQRDTHTLRATDPGLLTVETTGSAVDTKGTLNDGTNDITMDAGSGGNFEIVSPMDDDADYIVAVEGQTRGERGDYGLKVEFGVAEDLANHASTTVNRQLRPGRADYLFFTAPDTDAGDLFLTVETQKHADVTTETNTTGALFSPDGLVTTDTNSGTGNNFLLRAPIARGKDYIIEVTGSSSSTEGPYVLKTSSTPAPSQGSAPDGIMTSQPNTVITDPGEIDPHSITVTKAGTLQVKTIGTTDTVGVLYGPDGRQIATDDNSGTGTNFLITEYVEAGQYIVTVEGQNRSVTTAAYTLVVNFVEGATVDGPTTPTTPGTEQELRDQIADLQDDLDACLTPVETDARGALENPPDGGFRSGIGIISGWVCAAQEVEVRILRAPGVLVETLTVAHGTSRPDVPENSRCTNENAGFGMTYNFNHLREGEYTIRAYADGEEIGTEQTFEVVHLTEFAANDDDRFLRDLRAAECRVDDFPATGEDTFLLWEQSTQNFVIEDAG